MDQRPIFVAAHPRACSTAFERVFMTQRDRLSCIHEPFGDAFYYGPERMSERFEDDEQARLESGFSKSTYQTILDRFERESQKGKRLFIKDLVYYLVPPDGKSASIAPSIAHQARNKRGVGTNGCSNGANGIAFDPTCPKAVESEPGNPTVIPEAVLRKFHFTFLIRHPRHSVPSYYRCTIPPLVEQTGFHDFMPSEMGYSELRRLFDFLRSAHQVGPEIAGRQHGPTNGFMNGISEGESNGHTNGLTNGIPKSMVNGHSNGMVNGMTNGITNGHQGEEPPQVEICVIDADDLLDDPEGIVREFCASAGFEYDPSLLVWDTEEDHQQAVEAFEKWRGWHNDVLESKCLKPRAHKKQPKSEEQEYAEWVEKYGSEAAKVIHKTVQESIADYEYLKQFSLKLRN